MKFFAVLLLAVLALSAAADPKKKEYPGKFSPSLFEVVALNPLVKGELAKFLLKTPAGFEIDKVQYYLKNANHLRGVQKNFKDIQLVNGSQGKELHLNVNKLPPGFYQLYVKVKDKQNKDHELKTKYHDYVRFVIDESLGAPAPDEKLNNKTVQGIDSDGDGIRDDVGRYITATYVDNLKTKLAVRQMAMAMQQELLNVANKEISILASRKMLDSMSCIEFVTSFDEEGKIRDKLKSRMFNTKERINADIESNANFNGQEYMGPQNVEQEKAACDFNVDNF